MDPSQSARTTSIMKAMSSPFGPNDWPTAALLKVPMDSSQSPPPNEQCQMMAVSSLL